MCNEKKKTLKDRDGDGEENERRESKEMEQIIMIVPIVITVDINKFLFVVALIAKLFQNKLSFTILLAFLSLVYNYPIWLLPNAIYITLFFFCFSFVTIWYQQKNAIFPIVALILCAPNRTKKKIK